MKREDAEEFTQSLGSVLAGAARMTVLGKRLHVPKILGVDEQTWLDDYLRVYVQLSTRERRQIHREAARKLTDSGLSQREAAKALGIPETTIRRYLAAPNGAKNEEEPNPTNELEVAHAPNGAPSDIASKRKAAEDGRKQVLEKPADPEILPGVYGEDFFTGSRSIADNSVDLILTDPPYNSDASEADLAGTSLYGKAAQVAARILKPGGSFLVYSGQKYLPDVYGLINQPALRYWWTFAGVHTEGKQLLQKLGIRCGWKPIIWYVKGTRGDVSEILTDIVTGAREKEYHEWQQAEAEALHFIDKLTFPGGLVVDFFLGSGTTKAAADKLGRRFIGFEIDHTTAEKLRERFAGKIA